MMWVLAGSATFLLRYTNIYKEIGGFENGEL